GELGDQLVGPGAAGVELEAQARVELEPAVHDAGGRRVAEAGRDDELDGLWVTAEVGGEGRAGLAQREVERRALIGPATVRLRDLQRVREALERPGAGERQHRPGRLLAIVGLGVPGDVLAEPLLPTAAQPNDGCYAREPARNALLEPLELVALDLP